MDGPGTRVAVVIDSGVVGVAKPNPAIFHMALDAVGVPARRCRYIGDSVYVDVQGATSVGMPCAHVDAYRLCEADDHPHTASLREFTDVLLG